MQQSPRMMERLRQQVQGTMLPEDELLVIGYVGLAHTYRLIQENETELGNRFSRRFLVRTMMHAQENCLHGPEDPAGKAPDLRAFFPERWQPRLHGWIYAEKESFFTALWKLAEVSDVGLTMELRQLPVRQETIEICETLSLHPYKDLEAGCFIASVTGARLLTDDLSGTGVRAAAVGTVCSGRQRLLYSDGRARFLERPEL